MFKKAKRANFRRRNESDEEDHEEKQQLPPPPQPPLASTLFGPVVDEIPFMETSTSGGGAAAAGSADNHLSNGFLANAPAFRTVKKVKKGKDPAAVPVPAKASLLSFDDEEGNFAHRG